MTIARATSRRRPSPLLRTRAGSVGFAIAALWAARVPWGVSLPICTVVRRNCSGTRARLTAALAVHVVGTGCCERTCVFAVRTRCRQPACG